jgi:hypothetical protein
MQKITSASKKEEVKKAGENFIIRSLECRFIL